MISAKYASKFGLEEDHIYDFLFYAVPAALVGLRAYFVIFYLERFQNPDGSLDWPAIFRISDGGMAIYGGIIAGVIVLIYFAKAKKVSFFLMADVMTIGLILGQAIGRWGNFTNVEAYGGLTDGVWRMCSESIANEMLAKGYATTEQFQAILEGTLGVHPTFFYESMWNFVGFAILLRYAKGARSFEGQVSLTYFTWYGLGRFIIEGMRTDSLYFFGLEFMGMPLRTSQMLSLALFLVAGFFLYQGKKGKCSFLPAVKTVDDKAYLKGEDGVRMTMAELEDQLEKEAESKGKKKKAKKEKAKKPEESVKQENEEKTEKQAEPEKREKPEEPEKQEEPEEVKKEKKDKKKKQSKKEKQEKQESSE